MCGLVPWPGIEPGTPCIRNTQSLSHWTIKGVLKAEVLMQAVLFGFACFMLQGSCLFCQIRSSVIDVVLGGFVTGMDACCLHPGSQWAGEHLYHPSSLHDVTFRLWEMSLPLGVHNQDGRSICIPIQVSRFTLLLSLQNPMGFVCLFSLSFFFFWTCWMAVGS